MAYRFSRSLNIAPTWSSLALPRLHIYNLTSWRCRSCSQADTLVRDTDHFAELQADCRSGCRSACSRSKAQHHLNARRCTWTCAARHYMRVARRAFCGWGSKRLPPTRGLHRPANASCNDEGSARTDIFVWDWSPLIIGQWLRTAWLMNVERLTHSVILYCIYICGCC